MLECACEMVQVQILAEESLKRYRAAAFRFEQSLPRWAALAPELLSAIKSARSAEEFESQRRRRQAVYSAWQREAEQEHTEDAELSTEWVAYCVIVGGLVAISLICLVANEPSRSNQPTGRR